MHCKKCGGRMFVDRTFSDNNRLEVYCSLCGKRVYASRFDNAFGAWITKKETELTNSYMG
jgi:hypothetical protein